MLAENVLATVDVFTNKNILSSIHINQILSWNGSLSLSVYISDVTADEDALIFFQALIYCFNSTSLHI